MLEYLAPHCVGKKKKDGAAGGGVSAKKVSSLHVFCFKIFSIAHCVVVSSSLY